MGRQCRIRRRCGYTPKRLPAAQAYARAFARASKCARVCACVGLGFILFVHRTRFAAVSGRVRKKAVHACPEVHLCVRVWALGRPRVHMCMRACSRGDGRGVGRSRTAWETGLRSVGYPGSYGPTYVLRPVRRCCGRAFASRSLEVSSQRLLFQHLSVTVPHIGMPKRYSQVPWYSFGLLFLLSGHAPRLPKRLHSFGRSSMMSICCCTPILLTLVSAPAHSPCSADVSRRSIGYCSRQGSCLICA